MRNPIRGRAARWCLAAFLLLLSGALLRADDFDTLIEGWARYLTGGTNLNVSDPNVSTRVTGVVNTANGYWSSMDKSPSRTYLWSDAASATSESAIATCYGRLADMAQAWATVGSSLRGNTNLAADVVSGLDWVYTNRYNENVTPYGNWWYWEIGTPLALNEAMVLIYPELSGTQITNYCRAIDHFTPVVDMTGANRVWQAEVVGVRGATGRNAAKVAAARDGLTSVFNYVTTSDGFYRDGSFIQHGKHPYTGGYGNSLLRDLAKVMDWLSPTAYLVTASQRTNVIRWCYDSYEPLIFSGAIAEHVRGRESSRSGTGFNAGHDSLNAMLRIAQTAPAADAARLKSIVKYHAQADTTTTLGKYVDLDLVDDAAALLADAGVATRPELIRHFQFPSMDRVMHLRPGFGFTLSLFSSRVYNYESINAENLHGWFTSHGMSYLLTTNDITQFTDSFWPTVDPYHLPGTTVDLTPLANSVNQSKTSTQPWVGGAVLSNSFGATGMSLDDVNGPLVARKSWFMFDNEIVCLGAGISCSSATNVHTTVENRSLHSGNTRTLTVNGTQMPNTLGWTSNLTGVSWCSLDASGGYYFPGGANLRAARLARTGSLADIGTGSSTAITRNYVSLILDHGVAPNNAGYAYVLLPNATGSATAAYAANPQISILTNSASVQAVRESSLGITSANFWGSSGGTVDLFSCNKPAAVLAREGNDVLEIAVSDPTWTNTSPITMTFNLAASELLSADPGITVLALTPQLQLSVAVSGARGQTFQARFSLLPGFSAVSDSAATCAGTPRLVDVLANDISTLGTPILTSLTAPAHGTATITNQQVWYVPNANYTGPDSFNYYISDGSHWSTGAVTMAVGGPILSVSATQLSASGAQDGNPAVNVLDGSLDTRWSAQNVGTTNQWLQLDLMSTQLVRGVAMAFWPGTNRVAYFNVEISSDAQTWMALLTNAASSGTSANLETFPFTPSWTRFLRIVGLGNSQGTGWNSITELRVLAGTNAAPVALTDALALAAGTSASLNVLANDSDPDKGPQPLAVVSYTQPAHGVVTRNGAALRYQPAAGYSGSDAFSYTVSDSGLTSAGLVAVTVTNVPPPSLSCRWIPSGAFEITLNGAGGWNYRLEATTNPSFPPGWTTLLTTNLASLPFQWSDAAAVGIPARFYRAVVVP